MEDNNNSVPPKSELKKKLWTEIIISATFLVGYILLFGKSRENWVAVIWMLSIPACFAAIAYRHKERAKVRLSKSLIAGIIGTGAVFVLFSIAALGVKELPSFGWKFTLIVIAVAALVKNRKSLRPALETKLPLMTSNIFRSLKAMSVGRKVLLGIAVLLVIGLVGRHSGNGVSGFTSGSPRQSPWDNSVDVVEIYLKYHYLKDPDSYESVHWSKVQRNSDGTYSVDHQYRARNGFGGMMVEEKTFTISSDGERVIWAQ